MRRPVLIVLVAAFPALAQLAFYNGERRLETQFSLGTLPAGDSAETKLSLKNASSGPVMVRTLSAAGAGFSIPAGPRLPASLAPGSAFEFTLRFQAAEPGAFSARLSAENASVIVSATAVLAPVVVVDGDFGAVERGSERRRRVSLENRSAVPLQPGAVGVSGAGFSAQGAPAADASIPPGASAGFDLICRPASLGPMQGLLQVGLRRVALRASGVEPPLPAPELAVTLARPESGQQGRVEIRLAEVSRTRGSGEVRLEFRPAPGLGPDPSVMLSNSARSAPVRVEEGDAAARIGDRESIGFQTGSTAGEIRLTLQLGNFRAEKTIEIVPAVVAVSASQALRSGAALDLRVTGVDNTRSAGRLVFTFYDRRGAVVAPGAIQLDGGEVFRRYFSEGSGSFLLRATFPIAGPAEQLESVEAEVTNSMGTVRTGRVRF